MAFGGGEGTANTALRHLSRYCVARDSCGSAYVHRGTGPDQGSWCLEAAAIWLRGACGDGRTSVAISCTCRHCAGPCSAAIPCCWCFLDQAFGRQNSVTQLGPVADASAAH